MGASTHLLHTSPAQPRVNPNPNPNQSVSQATLTVEYKGCGLQDHSLVPRPLSEKSIETGLGTRLDHSPGIREPVLAGDGTVLVDYRRQTSRERLYTLSL